MKLLSALALAIAPLSLAASVFSPVMGLTAVPINPASNRPVALTAFSHRFVSPVYHTGTITAVGPSSVDVDQTAWMAAEALAGKTLYLVLLDGSASGKMATITALDEAPVNPANPADGRLSLTEALTGLAQVGGMYAVHAYLTIDDLFGSDNRAGFISGANPVSADSVMIYNSETGALTRVFYLDGPGLEESAGWYGFDYSPAGGNLLMPEQGFLVQRRADDASPIYLGGFVKTSPSALPIETNYTLLGTLKSLDGVRLDQSGLYTGNPDTGLAGGLNVNDADNLILFAADGSSKRYFFLDLPGSEGWYDQNYTPADDVTLGAGDAFFVQRRSGRGSFLWMVPAQGK